MTESGKASWTWRSTRRSMNVSKTSSRSSTSTVTVNHRPSPLPRGVTSKVATGYRAAIRPYKGRPHSRRRPKRLIVSEHAPQPRIVAFPVIDQQTHELGLNGVMALSTIGPDALKRQCGYRCLETRVIAAVGAVVIAAANQLALRSGQALLGLRQEHVGEVPVVHEVMIPPASAAGRRRIRRAARGGRLRRAPPAGRQDERHIPGVPGRSTIITG